LSRYVPPFTKNRAIAMNAPLPFQVSRVDKGVEILPRRDVWARVGSVLFILYVVATATVFARIGGSVGTSGAAILAAFALWLVLDVRRHRCLNGVPLRVNADGSISYDNQTIYDGGDVRQVRVVVQMHADDPNTFGVEVVSQNRELTLLPEPYFSSLEPADAARLAVELAKALRTNVLRGRIPVAGTPDDTADARHTQLAA
jgi:hypothetical protein